jgi:tetratricopeptide (TPR) repeat protein
MNRQRKADLKKPDQAESFEERIELLFEELSFAVQWQRPSILLVFYESEILRSVAELALAKRLAGIGQQVVQFKVDETHFDIPLLLYQQSDRDRLVYSVNGLSRGGGKESANAYRALNIRREYFVDHAIRVIVWLAKGEATELSRHAPDFWAFRHRVVEFNDTLDYDQSIRRLKQGILIAGQMNDITWMATLRGNLGALYLDLDLLPKAIRAYWKAIRTNPQDSDLWSGLGHTYLAQGRWESARGIFKQVTRINPQDVSGWIGLGHAFRMGKRYPDAKTAYQQAIRLDQNNPSANSAILACFRLAGRDDLVDEHRRITRPIMENATEYDRAVFESICGNTNEAIDLLAKALEKKQVRVNRIRHDPDLDFIRVDPGFEKIVGMMAPNPKEQ